MYSNVLSYLTMKHDGYWGL